MNWEKLSGIFDAIEYMAGVNLCFVASNIFLILFFLFVGMGQAGTCLPLFLLSLLPAAPALAAMFYAMNRYLEKKDTGSFRDYAKGFRSSLPVSLKAGAIQLVFIFMLSTNIRFFAGRSHGQVFLALSVALLCLAILMTGNLYYFAGIYDINVYGTIRAAITVTIGKPGTTLGEAAAFLLGLAVFHAAPALAVFFFAGAYGLVVAWMNRRLLDGH